MFNVVVINSDFICVKTTKVLRQNADDQIGSSASGQNHQLCHDQYRLQRYRPKTSQPNQLQREVWRSARGPGDFFSRAARTEHLQLHFKQEMGPSHFMDRSTIILERRATTASQGLFRRLQDLLESILIRQNIAASELLLIFDRSPS